MMRRVVIVGIVLIAGCLKLNFPWQPPPVAPPLDIAAAGPRVGQPAPEIVGEDIDGVPFRLSDYRGHVVVLDFWGHW
jgi:hypothetical protein